MEDKKHRKRSEKMLSGLLFVFGVCIGSFINVVIYRLPLKKSFVFDRSYCEYCGQKLYWYDLIPIFSYFNLNGKCRFCHHQIRKMHPIVEFGSGILLVICFRLMGFSTMMIISYLIIEVLLIIGIIDYQRMRIYESVLLVLLLLVVVYRFFNRTAFNDMILGAIMISSLMIGVNFLVNDAFGFGDIELVVISGILLGWQLNLISFSLSVILASIYSLRLLLQGKCHLKSLIPFGPFLTLSMALVFLFGQDFLTIYLMVFS